MARRSPTQTFFDIIFITVFLLLLLAAQPDHSLQKVVAQCPACLQWSGEMSGYGEVFGQLAGQAFLAFREMVGLVRGVGGYW